MEKYNLNQTGPEVQEILDGAATLADVNAEKERAEAAEQQNADDIDAIENKIPSGASLENKLATIGDVNDEANTRAGADNALRELIDEISALIPEAASALNQLADKQFVSEEIIEQIVADIPNFAGQFTTLAQLQDVESPKAGDIGIVRTKDTDGHDVFAFYQYKNDQWNEFYTLSYHPQDKPATTGLVGEAPYNGMGRVELPMNWVEGWPNDTWLYYPYNGVVYLMYYWNGLLYAPYNSGTQEGLGLDDNLVVKPLDYNIADIEQFVGERYLPFTESSGVWTITKPDDSTITSTELNNTNIYKINDPTHLGINVLTQAMLNRPNTIYVIQHDFTLGEDITVPANCVLEFDGGSISGNGTGKDTITGNETSIIYNGTILDNVICTGSWNVPCIKSSMFKEIHRVNSIQKLFSLCNDSIKNTIIIESGNYECELVEWVQGIAGRAITLVNKKNIELIINGNLILDSNGLPDYDIVWINECENIKVCGNGSIVGDKDTHDYTTNQDSGYRTHEWGRGIHIVKSKNVEVCGLTMYGCTGDGLTLGDATLDTTISNNFYIHDITIHDCRRQGITVAGIENLVIDNFVIYNIVGTVTGTNGPGAGIDVEPDDNLCTCNNISITNGTIKNCEGGVLIIRNSDNSPHIQNVHVSNVMIDHCTACMEIIACIRVENAVIENVIMDFCGGSDLTPDSLGTKHLILNGKTYNVTYKNIRANYCQFQHELIYNNQSEVYFIDSYFHMEVDGSHIWDFSQNSKTMFENVKFNGGSLLFGGVSGRHVHNKKFIGCTINVNDASAVYFDVVFDNCQITASAWEDSPSENLTFIDCLITTPLRIVGTNNVKCKNVTFENCEINGLILVSIGDNVKILNCRGAFQPYMRFVDNVIIEKCKFSTTDFIMLTGGSCIVVENNVIEVSTGFLYTLNNDARITHNVIKLSDSVDPTTTIDLFELQNDVQGSVKTDNVIIDNEIEILNYNLLSSGSKPPFIHRDFASKYGSTRPVLSSISIGQEFFDTTPSVSKPIYWTGSDWVDATGTPV